MFFILNILSPLTYFPSQEVPARRSEWGTSLLPDFFTRENAVMSCYKVSGVAVTPPDDNVMISYCLPHRSTTAVKVNVTTPTVNCLSLPKAKNSKWLEEDLKFPEVVYKYFPATYVPFIKHLWKV